MTIQQCKYILKIAQCGSFNEAAKQLFVAQSSLSVSVKSLEQELGVPIFERAGSGVCLTEEGAEFARYARQLVAESEFILDRYAEHNGRRRLYVATQHYDFVADLFVQLLNEVKDPCYHLSLQEMKTYDVIHQTKSGLCDVGVLAIRGNNIGVMERYLGKHGLRFCPVLKALPHAYLRREHPLADRAAVTAEELSRYPCVSYEQGEHDLAFFAEEITVNHSDRQVEVSDRASLMNVLLASDGYTLGTGIMPSELNKGRIVCIPFQSEDFYTIGYILRGDRDVSELTERFLELLCGRLGSLR